MALPPLKPIQYNKTKLGYFGELGNGANARIRFLQCAVTKAELDDITLIENIPGSEKWDIRDLFQRDVDMVRVTESILPYLTDADKVKFFNPLTLVLLPFDDKTDAVDSEVTYVEGQPITKNDHAYTKYGREGLFSFEVHNEHPAYSELSWNSGRVKLVAIDGQHRLSALKFWKDSPGPKDLDSWQIPVVILGIFKADNDSKHKPANLLEIVRKTFIYINSRAEEVNVARRILLDDEEIQAVCTQELVQESHVNDCLPDSKMDPNKVPLLFFDWRGQVKWRKDEGESIEIVAPGSVLKIDELYAWLDEYILEEKPGSVLQLEDLDPPLSKAFQDHKVLTHDDTVRIRDQFMKVIYPGISYLLEHFEPYRKYVQQIRLFEKAERKKSEAAGYVFQKLRFGSHAELHGQMKDLVDSLYKTTIDQLQKMRQNCFDPMIDRDIGMRAIVYAFGDLKKVRDEISKKTGSWKEHAEWFVPKINSLYKAGWFKSYADLSTEHRKVLTHISFDNAGQVINYKITDVPRALGSLVSLLVIGEAIKEFKKEQQADLWDHYRDVLDNTLSKGFRKEHRSRLQDVFKGTRPELIAEVNKRVKKSVADRLELIQTDVVGIAE